MTGTTRKCCWMFTGQGSQWPGMAASIVNISSHIEQRLAAAEQYFQDRRGVSLIDAIDSPDGDVNQTGITQPALYVVECALVDHWRSTLCSPAAVIGHSVGEYAAAYATGVFGFQDGLMLIEARGRLMQALPSGGRMLAVKASAQDLRDILGPTLDEHATELAIAAVNAPKQTVLSGAGARVAQAAQTLKAKGYRSRELTVSHAFHSPLMAPMLTEFSSVANRVRYAAPNIPFYSSLSAKQVGDEIADPAYWVDHVSKAVLFCDTLRCLNDVVVPDSYLEIGPNPILSGLAKRCLASDTDDDRKNNPRIVASMSQKEDAAVSLESARGELVGK